MKKTATTTKSPADLRLTAAQARVFAAIKDRQERNLVTTRSDIVGSFQTEDGKDKSWICKILAVLISRGLVERYDQRYYKLA